VGSIHTRPCTRNPQPPCTVIIELMCRI
jgi:hypothetical protein